MPYPRTARVDAVGVVAVSRLHDAARGDTLLYVDQLYVLPAYRGRGVARHLLLRAACVCGGDRGALIVRKHATQQAAARRLYAAAGFRPRAVPPQLRDGDADAPVISLAPCTAKDARHAGRGDDAVEEYREVRMETMAKRLHAAPASGLRVQTVKLDTFLRKQRGLLAQMERHHRAAHGGDGADVRSVLRCANDGLFVAYLN
jgi:hypothetical protein